MSVTTSPAQNMKNSMNNHFLRSVPNAKIDGTHSPTKSPYCFASSGLPAHSAARNQSPTLSKKLNPEATKMEPVKTLFIVSSFKNVVKNRESRQIIRSEQSISRVKRAKRVDESESYGQQNNVLNAIFSVDFNGLEIRDRGFGWATPGPRRRWESGQTIPPESPAGLRPRQPDRPRRSRPRPPPLGSTQSSQASPTAGV